MTEFCTSVAIMERGRMVVSGTIADVQKRVMGGTVLEVEVLGDPGAFEAVIGADPHVGLVERINGTSTFSVSHQGGAEEASDLLAKLVGAGVRVSSFGRRREGLEELFLKVGARELS